MAVEIIPIDDPDDPRVEPYRRVRERDLAGRDGTFIAEGEIVVRTLLSPLSRFRVASLLLAAPRAGGLAERLGAHESVPVFAAGRAVMDRIVGFPIHRGVLAQGLRGPADASTSVPPDGLDRASLVLGLVGLANHDNVGGAFRNAAAFGAEAVLLDAGCCDPLYRKAIRVSAGAALTVPFRRGGTPETMVEKLVAAGSRSSL